MTILKQLKEDRLQALKNGEKNKYESLTVLLSEAEKIGKDNGNRESSDEEVIKIIKKMISICQDTIQILENTTDNIRKDNLIEKWKQEIINYEKYIPKQLSKEDLILTIEEIINIKNLSEMKDIGIIMNGLKSKYEGRFDGKLASSIIKNIFTK